MRTVVAHHLLSLDGVAEAPETFVDGWDEVMDANLASVIEGQDAVILGRRSYAIEGAVESGRSALPAGAVPLPR